MTIGSAADNTATYYSLKEARALLKEAETALREPSYIHTVHEGDDEYIVLHAPPGWSARRTAILAKLKFQTPLLQEDGA